MEKRTKSICSDKFSVKNLRSMNGDIFETYAAVIKSPGDRLWYQRAFSLIFEERNFVPYGEVKRLVIVKGKNCFIFVDEYASTPINAFPLEGLYAELENRKKPDKKSVTVSPEGKNSLSSSSLSTILLRSVSTEKIAYQISFDMKGDKTIVDKFLEASASSLSYIDGKVGYSLT